MSISEIQHVISHLHETMPGYTATVTFSQRGLCTARQFFDIDLSFDGKTVYSSGCRHTLEEAVNDVRAQVERDIWEADHCAYCGGDLDGEVCYNMACVINLEVGL